MKKQSQPRLVKPPTFRDVLIGVGTAYRPIKKEEFKLNGGMDFEKKRSKALVNGIFEFRSKFIPEVSFMEITKIENALIFKFKVQDVEHDGKKINAWDFYNEFPDKIEDKIRTGFLDNNPDIEIDKIEFEKGSLVILITIALTGISVTTTTGFIAGVGVTSIFLGFYTALERKPDIKQVMDSIDEPVFKGIEKFVDDSIDFIRNLFGGLFGDRGMGF